MCGSEDGEKGQVRISLEVKLLGLNDLEAEDEGRGRERRKKEKSISIKAYLSFLAGIGWVNGCAPC